MFRSSDQHALLTGENDELGNRHGSMGRHAAVNMLYIDLMRARLSKAIKDAVTKSQDPVVVDNETITTTQVERGLEMGRFPIPPCYGFGISAQRYVVASHYLLAWYRAKPGFNINFENACDDIEALLDVFNNCLQSFGQDSRSLHNLPKLWKSFRFSLLCVVDKALGEKCGLEQLHKQLDQVYAALVQAVPRLNVQTKVVLPGLERDTSIRYLYDLTADQRRSIQQLQQNNYDVLAAKGWCKRDGSSGLSVLQADLLRDFGFTPEGEIFLPFFNGGFTNRVFEGLDNLFVLRTTTETTHSDIESGERMGGGGTQRFAPSSGGSDVRKGDRDSKHSASSVGASGGCEDDHSEDDYSEDDVKGYHLGMLVFGTPTPIHLKVPASALVYITRKNLHQAVLHVAAQVLEIKYFPEEQLNEQNLLLEFNRQFRRAWNVDARLCLVSLLSPSFFQRFFGCLLSVDSNDYFLYKILRQAVELYNNDKKNVVKICLGVNPYNRLKDVSKTDVTAIERYYQSILDANKFAGGDYAPMRREHPDFSDLQRIDFLLGLVRKARVNLALSHAVAPLLFQVSLILGRRLNEKNPLGLLVSFCKSAKDRAACFRWYCLALQRIEAMHGFHPIQRMLDHNEKYTEQNARVVTTVFLDELRSADAEQLHLGQHLPQPYPKIASDVLAVFGSQAYGFCSKLMQGRSLVAPILYVATVAVLMYYIYGHDAAVHSVGYAVSAVLLATVLWVGAKSVWPAIARCCCGSANSGELETFLAPTKGLDKHKTKLPLAKRKGFYLAGFFFLTTSLIFGLDQLLRFFEVDEQRFNMADPYDVAKIAVAAVVSGLMTELFYRAIKACSECRFRKKHKDWRQLTIFASGTASTSPTSVGQDTRSSLLLG